MNREELNEQIDAWGCWITDNENNRYISTSRVKSLISKLDEPTHEPVEVPSFIGRYIQKTKAKRNLKWAMQDILNDLHDDEFNAWFENDSNFEVFAKAWMYGYKEKESLYVMPVPYAPDLYYYRDFDSEIRATHREEEASKFTEAEINEYFPKIANFKEEVEV